jgi:hypothetical protein
MPSASTWYRMGEAAVGGLLGSVGVGWLERAVALEPLRGFDLWDLAVRMYAAGRTERALELWLADLRAIQDPAVTDAAHVIALRTLDLHCMAALSLWRKLEASIGEYGPPLVDCDAAWAEDRWVDVLAHHVREVRTLEATVARGASPSAALAGAPERLKTTRQRIRDGLRSGRLVPPRPT